LLPAEVSAEKGEKPRPERVGMIDVEIGIALRSRMAMMGEMLADEAVIIEPGIEQQGQFARRPIPTRSKGCKRSMHGVMGDDEQANRQPGLQRDQRRSDPPGRDLKIDHEYADGVHRRPCQHDETRQP